ncbi:hypothetical protein HZA99_06440 [Candidatus Woesearchaeota archaeon]|nr:hypothetical protein [Candidatus Woesearchaeota archaeon]
MAENLNTKNNDKRYMRDKRIIVDAIQFVAIVASVAFYTLLNAPIVALFFFVICLAIAWFRFEIYKQLA